MKHVKVQHAKTHLSQLLVEVEAGEEIVVERGSKPVAKIVPLHSSPSRRLGFMQIDVPDSFFEPLDDDALRDWYGE